MIKFSIGMKVKANPDNILNPEWVRDVMKDYLFEIINIIPVTSVDNQMDIITIRRLDGARHWDAYHCQLLPVDMPEADGDMIPDPFFARRP